MATVPKTFTLNFNPDDADGGFFCFLDLVLAPQRDTSKDTPLIKAVLADNVEEVEACLAKHQESKNLAEAMLICDATGKTAFSLACSASSPNPNIIKLLYPHLTPEVVKSKDNNEETAFSQIIQNSELDELSYQLIKDGLLSPFELDKDGDNVLMLAVNYKHNKLIKALLSGETAAVKLLVETRNKEGMDALDMALSIDEYESAEALVKLGCDIEALDANGKTRFMKAVNEWSDKAVQFLIHHGANINARDKNGDTSFIQMLREDKNLLARYLIEQGVDITITDATGKTALEILRAMPVTEENQDCIAESIKLLTSPPPRLPLPIDYGKMCRDALQKGDKETLEYASAVLREDFLTDPMENGLTPLHIAAKLGHRNIVEFLLGEKADMFAKDELGNTPLMYAAMAGQRDMVKFLHQSGSSINCKNKANETVLQLATKHNCTTVVDYLEEMHAKETLKITRGGLSRDSFIEKNSQTAQAVTPEVLLPKGLALVLAYYNHKDKNLRKQMKSAYVADSQKSLEHALGLLQQAKDGTEYGILCCISGHNMAIKCEKIRGQNHIILMDSLGSLDNHPAGMSYGVDNHAEILENIVANLFVAGNNTFFYKNREGRQTSGEICGIYTAKDVRKMLNIDAFSQKIHQEKHVQATTKNKAITVYSYRTPAEFMRLAQSPAMLEQYRKENKEEAERLLRKDKTGKFQKLMDYALTPREKFGLKTPEQIANRKYGPDNPEEPQYVYKNHSIIYFTRKYIDMIDNLVKKCSFDKLVNWIETHNAEYLKIGPNGKVMSLREERTMLEMRALEDKRRMEEKQRQEIELERKSAEEWKKYQQMVHKNHKNIDLYKDGIILKDDIINEAELIDYIYSPENPWNGTFFAPAFLFSTTTLAQFAFDRVSYLKEIAQELRDKKNRVYGGGMTFVFSKPDQSQASHSAGAGAGKPSAAAAGKPSAAGAGIARFQTRAEGAVSPTPEPVIGTIPRSSNGPGDDGTSQPPAKRRRVVAGT